MGDAYSLSISRLFKFLVVDDKIIFRSTQSSKANGVLEYVKFDDQIIIRPT